MMITKGRRVSLAVVVAFVVVVAAVVAFVVTRKADPTAVPRPVASSSPSGGTASVTPAPTSMPSVAPPTLPAAATVKSQKGAEAFFRYFLVLYSYSYNALDASAIERISSPECKFCASVAANVRAAREADQSVGAPLVVVQSLVVSPGSPSSGLIVVAVVDQESVVTRDRNGIEVNRSERSVKTRLDARVTWSVDHWIVRGVQIVAGDKK